MYLVKFLTVTFLVGSPV